MILQLGFFNLYSGHMEEEYVCRITISDPRKHLTSPKVPKALLNVELNDP